MVFFNHSRVIIARFLVCDWKEHLLFVVMLQQDAMSVFEINLKQLLFYLNSKELFVSNFVLKEDYKDLFSSLSPRMRTVGLGACEGDQTILFKFLIC